MAGWDAADVGPEMEKASEGLGDLGWQGRMLRLLRGGVLGRDYPAISRWVRMDACCSVVTSKGGCGLLFEPGKSGACLGEAGNQCHAQTDYCCFWAWNWEVA